MIFTGTHLFQYTNIETSLKIFVTGSLKYGKFEDMNNITEVVTL